MLITIMVATVSVLMMAHGLEVLVWALTYEIVGAVPQGADVLYFAFVNYTTLGYGDVVPVERWRLIGPTTAMNALMMNMMTSNAPLMTATTAAKIGPVTAQ